MKKSILAEKISFTKSSLKKSLKSLESNVIYDIKGIVYYPYLFFEFKVNDRRSESKTGKAMGCTIDGINKLGSLVDRPPQYYEQMIDQKFVMNMLITKQEALAIAERFLLEAITTRIKILRVPTLTLNNHSEFYRPYWIVEGERAEKGSFFITVDAVTGKYHPI